MNEITLFNFEGSQVRVSLDAQGDPWFVAKDVCDALGHSNPRQMLADNVDRDDVSAADVIDAMGRNQSTNCINESGLYSLIMGSRLEGAKRFKRWVTSEVLPAIRKTGSYTHTPAAEPARLRSDAAESQAAIIRDTALWMRSMVPSIRPEMAAASTLRALTAAGLMTKPVHEEMRNLLADDWDSAPSLTPTQIGERLGGVPPQQVNRMLEARGLQRRIGGRWDPTPAGKPFAGAVPYQSEHGEHRGVQLKWAPAVLSQLSPPPPPLTVCR